MGLMLIARGGVTRSSGNHTVVCGGANLSLKCRPCAFKTGVWQIERLSIPRLLDWI